MNSSLVPQNAISKRKAKRLDGIVRVQESRADQTQQLGYLAKPFLLLGLPFKRAKGVTIYKRTNGTEKLEIRTDSPEHGLPFGEDLLVLIWVSTLAVLQKQVDGQIPQVIEFSRAADMLKAFGLPLDGRTYRRMQERFLRVLHATFYYGKPSSKGRENLYRFHFFDGVDLWFTRDLETAQLPGDDFKNNRVVLSDAFRRDLQAHHPPIDLKAVRLWADAPGQLYFYLWLTYRCYVARGRVDIALMGAGSLMEQCGLSGYEDPEKGPRNLRAKVKKWLAAVKLAWADCPVKLTTTPRGDFLTITGQAKAINARVSG